ncbi:MAG: hypothetical protein QXM15_01460, partial [Archaeoglobaceae archaeon]
GIEAIFPLWGENTKKLAEDIAREFNAIVIAVRKNFKDILGRRFDEEVIEYLLKKNADPCGENGEFHTIVVDGPIFKKPIEVTIGKHFEDEKYYYLEVL